MRKYIFRAGNDCFISAAIRMWLCCRLIITSEHNNEWNVPVKKRRINMSSIAVSDERRPPCRLAAEEKEKARIISNNNKKKNASVTSSTHTLTHIPWIPSFSVGNKMWWIGHFVGEWPISFWCDFISARLYFSAHGRRVQLSLQHCACQRHKVDFAGHQLIFYKREGGFCIKI